MARSDGLRDAVARVEGIGREAGVAEEVIAALRQPRSTRSAALPVRRDDGSTVAAAATTTHSARPRAASASIPA